MHGSLGIFSTLQILTSEFFSPNSYSLYQGEGKSQDGKTASAEAQQYLAGYMGRIEGRPVQLELGEQRKSTVPETGKDYIYLRGPNRSR